MHDILIRGISMPERGCKTIVIHSSGSVYGMTNSNFIVDKIAEAIELPPHGDLIEMDKLYNTMETYTDYGGAMEPHDENQIHRDSILFAIETAPVIVSAEGNGIK